MRSINQFPRTAFGGKVVNGEFEMLYQVWVHNAAELQQLINDSNERCSVFVSHNAYPSRGKQEHHITEEGCEGCPDIRTDISEVTINQQFYDMDSDKIENAFGDLRKLVEWAEKERWKWHAVFSGGKGFHFFLIHDPATYDITKPIMVDSRTPVQWRSYYLAAFAYLKHTLGLRTLDLNCAEPKRICRVWGTAHFKKGHDKPSGTYCIPLTLDQVMNWNVQDIVEMSKRPTQAMTQYAESSEYWNRVETKRALTFDQWLDYYGIEPSILSLAGNTDASKALIADMVPPMSRGPTGLTPDWWEFFKALWPSWPCMWNHFYNSRNPKHEARFHTAALLKKMADDRNAVMRIDGEFLFQMYQSLKYDDVRHTDVCRQQIYSIFERGPRSSRKWLPVYEPYPCARLFAAGLCIGEKCDEVLPDKKKFSRYLKKVKVNL